MEYPTFGGDDGKLQLCVQSLDRKGEVPQGNDRLRVLINRAPKRHRSITALNFFACPQNAQVPPVPPMPTPVAPKRPLPRFLEIFEPLNSSESVAPVSNVSTPSTGKSSLPVTPASPPHRELSNDLGHHQSPSYFPLIPVQQTPPARTLMDNSRAHPQPYHGFAEILPSDENKEADLLEQQYTPTFQTARSDRSFEWTMRGEREGNMLMMDGTFGRA